MAYCLAFEWFVNRPIRFDAVARTLLFFQNYLPGYAKHTWSLAVEEHCYLSILCVLLGLSWAGRGAKNPFRMIPAITIVGAGMILAFRVWHGGMNRLHGSPEFSYQYVFPKHLRGDGFLMGVLVAYCYHFHREGFMRCCQRWQKSALVLGVVLLVPAFVWPLHLTPYLYTWGFSVNIVAGVLLMVAALGQPKLFGTPGIALAKLGNYSYSIYLWHFVLVSQIYPRFVIQGGYWPNYWLFLTSYLALSVLLGVLMTRLIEEPALRLRDQLFPAEMPKLPPHNIEHEIEHENSPVLKGPHCPIQVAQSQHHHRSN